MNNKLGKDNLKIRKYDFAILVDSSCDVPAEYIQKFPIYEVPLRINYKDASYRDGIDILPEEVYTRLNEEIPKTSLPEYSDVEEIIEQIIKDGYNKIISISISSNLSGTFNLLRLISDEFNDKETKIHLFDTKNVSIGSGLYAISVANHLEEGKSYEETIKLLEAEYGNSKIFFCVETLEYLRKGGRIGRVASMLGGALGIKPVITCGEDGTYTIAGKERGFKRCINKAIDLAKEFASKGKSVEVALMYSSKTLDLENIKIKIEQLIPRCKVRFVENISPALGVHVGPGLIGIGVYLIR